MARPTLGSLFEPPPPRWGLRGDPGLWAELANQLADVELPASFCALWSTLESAYAAAVGQPLTATGPVSIERFDRGGMSAGMVHPETWAKTLFPLICQRYADRIYGGAQDTRGHQTP